MNQDPIVRPTWDQINIEIARLVARRTTCIRALQIGGVGAVLVERDTHRILGAGYCGSLPGQPHCTDVGCLKIGEDSGCHRTVHAEMNALLFARDFDGPKILYSTLSPCMKCLQHAIIKGVVRIVFDQEYRISDPQRQLAAESNVEWIQHHSEPLRIVSAALRTADGRVYHLPPPARHDSVIKLLANRQEVALATQGFLTSTGNFVNREDAARIAFGAGQIDKPKEGLFSEDLW